MTTYTSFAPSTAQAFQFQPTLDGEVYTCTVTWNLFGQRYYVNLYDLSGNLIFCLPLIGSPTGTALLSLTWANGAVYAVTQVPHGYPTGATIALTVVGTTPTAYSGLVTALVTGPTTFTYPLATNPGVCTVPGTVEFNVDMAGGYFTTSTLVFRDGTQQFEVRP